MRNIFHTGAFLIFGLLVCTFFGLIIPIIGLKFSALLVAGFIGSFALLLSTHTLILGLLAVTLLIVGPLGYFGIVNLQWIPYIVGALLYVKFLIERFRVTESGTGYDHSTKLPGFHIFILIYAVVILISTATSPPGSHLLMLASRNYFFLWSVFLLLSMRAVTPDFFKRAWQLMCVVAFLQLPFAFYQHFYIAKNRIDSASWDAVVGTFQGYKEAGGDSGGMAIFLLSVFALALAMWRRGSASAALVVAIGITGLLTILLAEVKVVFVLFPIVFIGVYRSAILRDARAALVGTSIIALLATTVFLSYDHEYSNVNSTIRQKPVSERIEDMFKYSTAGNVFLARGEVGRVTALALWWNGTDKADPATYFGHGMGSTLVSQRPGEHGGIIGERYHPLFIDASAAATLLWDGGVVGALAFLMILVLAAASAMRLSRQSTIPRLNAAILDATPAILSMYLFSVFYHKNAIGGSTGGQLVLLVILGHVSYWYGQKNNDAPIRHSG